MPFHRIHIYNSNTINAFEPSSFASNDFISKIPNYGWHIMDVTRDKSGANMGILEIYNGQKLVLRISNSLIIILKNSTHHF